MASSNDIKERLSPFARALDGARCEQDMSVAEAARRTDIDKKRLWYILLIACHRLIRCPLLADLTFGKSSQCGILCLRFSQISDACPQYGNMHDGLSSLAIDWNMHREDRTFSKTAFNGYRCVVKCGRVLGYRQPETGPSAFF